jgi:lipoprotein-releasing system permease protein
MGFIGYIASRFLRSRRSRFLSLITVYAGLGITISVMVLNVTLAVMNGFRDQIQLKFVENMPMVTVMNSRGLEDLDDLVRRIEDFPGVSAASPFIRSETVLTLERIPGKAVHRGAVMWGVVPERQERVTPFGVNISPPFEGFATDHLPGGGTEIPGVVLGVELAAGLRALVGDVVALHAPRRIGPGEYGTETREFLVVGVLESGMYEFDVSFAYVDLHVAQELFDLPGSATGIGVRVRDMMRAPQIAEGLEQDLGYPPYYANDWISLNQQLFEWIQMEKALMFLLLCFLSLVASFTIVAILTVMVRDRQRDIGIFMSLGVSRQTLVGIFVQLGMVIGSVGTALGSGLGLILILVVDRVGIPLPGDVLFVNTLPVHAKLTDFLLVGGVSLLLTFLATLLPSRLAARLTPVEVLRYE